MLGLTFNSWGLTFFLGLLLCTSACDSDGSAYPPTTGTTATATTSGVATSTSDGRGTPLGSTDTRTSLASGTGTTSQTGACIDELVGSYVEFVIPTPYAEPLALTVGPGRNDLWFVEMEANKVGRITLEGEITEFALPTQNCMPFDIVAGPDGNIWFTEPNPNQIARITPAGEIKEFVLPPEGQVPLGLAAGPDGNVWFAERAGIGRITPTGDVTEFPIDGGVNAIASAPSGELWAATAANIWKINRDGTSSASYPFHQFSAITIGTDRNIWFTFSTRIGRFTPSQGITMFETGGGTGVETQGIAAGPDGSLWFTAYGYGMGKIGRITQTGAVNLFTVPSHMDPVGITAGPDGNIWFIGYPGSLGRIGRITPCKASK